MRDDAKPEENPRARIILVAALSVIWIIFTVTSGHSFLSSRNLSNLVRQITILGILAFGMQFVFITGNIDLTVGILAGFTSLFAAALQAVFLRSLPGVLATVITIVLCLAFTSTFGAYQGFLVGRLRLPSIMVAIGNSLLLVGLLPLTAFGGFATNVDKSLVFLGQGYFGPIPGAIITVAAILTYAFLLIRDRKKKRRYKLKTDSAAKDLMRCGLFTAAAVFYLFYVANAYRGYQVPVLIFLTAMAFLSYLLSSTRFGIRCQAIGYSRSVARFSGVSVNSHIVRTYVLSGLMAGIAGIVMTGYTSFGTMGDSSALSFSALSACLIGVIGFGRERLAIVGAAFGALFLGSIDNWMVLADLAPFLKEIGRGLLLIVMAFMAVRLKSSPSLFSD